MTDFPETTRDELIQMIEQSWDEFTSAIEQLQEEVLTSVKDRQGWTIKDHLAHITAWERSVLFLLQGKERFHGLGVSEETFLTGDFDTINAAIHQQTQNNPLEFVMGELEVVHFDLVTILRELQDSDLQEPVRTYIPEGSRDDSTAVLIQWILGNTTEHYDEHLSWIETLVD
jgi:hypothetical protein